MIPKIIVNAICAMAVWIAFFPTGSIVHAQPEEIVLNHIKDFKIKRRPPVTFPHEFHMERFECLDCHHRYENGKNVLDEDELAEGSPAARCSTCHSLKDKCDLQKAFHRQCLGCHVNQKTPGEPTGPRMCVGCHKHSLLN